MNIYKDPLSVSLGIRPMAEACPDFQYDIPLPEDAEVNRSGHLNPFWGLTHTDETKAKLRKAWDNPERKSALVSYAQTPEAREKRIKSLNTWYENASQEEINAKSKSGLNSMNAKIECPHCGIKTNKGNIGRYHGNKCKKRVDIT
jgi:hypothetical protein